MPVKGKNKYALGGAPGGPKPVEIKLPSLDEDGEHNVCLARRLGVQGLIKLGILDSLDTLTSMVNMKVMDIEKGMAATGNTSVDAQNLAALADDSGKIVEALALVDKIVIAAVVEPKVKPIPLSGERDADALYIDAVDLEDKMFIMNFTVGGPSDLATFRSGLTTGLDGMEAVPSLPVPAE